MRKVAIFDVDDIMWGLNEKIAKIIGYDMDYITNFSIRKCSQIDEKTQNKIIELYGDAKVFEDMDFFEGVEDLLILQERGVDVRICSNSMTRAIAMSKMEQLLAKVKGLQENQLQMNIISEASHNNKEMDKGAWMLVDDSPYNIAKSDAEIDVMKPYPWNQSTEGKIVYKDKNPIVIPTFKEILDYAYGIAV